ncbi:unnamed protein product [Brassica oleracea var. botrytis]
MGDPNLPPCIFSPNKEPSGERSIFEALDSEELVFLRNLTFAKVLILDDNPPFFDAFGNFRTCEEVEDKQDVQNLDFVCLEA